MGMSFTVRRLRREDVPAVARLYHETVHRVNAADYSAAQIAAWSPGIYPLSWWLRRFRRQRVFVATVPGEVVGFAGLARAGYLDCLYVHHEWQGRGVGRDLVRRVAREALRLGSVSLRADASVTARPFFLRQGFRQCRVQVRRYRNQVFKQYRMQRPLRRQGPPAGPAAAAARGEP